MLKSFRLFVLSIFKSIYFWISLFYTLLDRLIKSYIPEEYQRIADMSLIGFILVSVMIFIACFSAYHKLRMARLEEFYKFSPEANGDRIFRIFYNLYKDGKFEKNAGTQRKQEWDVKVLQEIKEFCTKNFERNYLLSTGRRNDVFTPLEDDNYDNALLYLKNFIDRDFNQFVKV